MPHAGLWLNDTVNGTEGTFVPLANAAVNADHMYVLAAFRALENSNPEGSLVSTVVSEEILAPLQHYSGCIVLMSVPQ